MGNDNSKRIAKNTIFLYMRMLLIMGVSIFTSRVILQTLGIEDFGIYNVVGGLASSFTFFSSSLSNSTQRFLNIKLGEGDAEGAKNVFGLSILVYAIIAIIVVIIAEIVGIWFINNKLVIPTERLDAANLVFHTTIISLAITLIGSVFDSVLIARENMKIYAYVSIIEVLFKLGIVYMLNWWDFDKLKLYAVFFLISHLSVKSISIIYCLYKYPECKFEVIWDKSLFKNLFSFTGWNLIGTAVWMINEQGTNILLNIFFGPSVNAARAISVQVKTAVNNFSSNFFTAVRPQIIKSYARKDYAYFTKLINTSSKFSFLLLWFLCLPIIMRSQEILDLWLDKVPEHAPDFVQWTLLYICVNVLTNPFWNGIQAIGKLNSYIIIGSLVFLSAFPISFIFLKLGYQPIVVYQTLIVVRLIYLYATIKIFCKYVDFSIATYFKHVILPLVMVVSLSSILSILVNPYTETGIIGIVTMTIACTTINIICIFVLGTSKSERNLITGKLSRLFKKNQHGK